MTQRSDATGDHEGPAERRKTSPAIRAERAAELAALKADIAARLRPICSRMTDAEFDEFALEMARMELRFRDIDRRLNR